MSGIYVAKPAASTALVPGVDVPIGWPPAWTFPGPWPPGYTPELTYALSAGSTYTPGDSHATSATLFDQETFKTSEPQNEYILSATLDGSPIVLAKTGGDPASASLTLSHDELDDSFWGASVNLEFGVTEDDDEKVITLTIKSHPWDEITDAVVDSIEITVSVEVTWTAVLTCVTDGYKGQWLEAWNVPPYTGQNRRSTTSWGTYIYFGNNGGYHFTPYAEVEFKHENNYEGEPPDPYWIFNHANSSNTDFTIACPEGEVRGYGCDFPRIVGSSAEGSVVINVIQFREYYPFPWQPLTYHISIEHNKSYTGPGNDVTYVYTLNMYRNETLYSTTIKTVVKTFEDPSDGDPITWLTIDGTTKEITVVNP